MSKYRPVYPFIFSVLAAAVYGLTIRAVYWLGSIFMETDTLIGVLGVGFLFGVPLVIGLLTVYIKNKRNFVFAIFAPWMACIIFSGLAALLSWEAWGCVIMATPIFLVMSSIGGIVMAAFISEEPEGSKPGMTTMGIVLMIPLLVTPLESLVPYTDSIRVVHTQIEVEASPEVVWQQITRVAPIATDEHRFSYFHWVGLPRPMYATLTHDGVGGLRRGQWENGLAFTEEIIDWERHRSYRMRMSPDVENVLPSTLPLHQIGGRYFDILEGHYEIEPLDNNRVMLHFTSTYRLTTRFNTYGGLWTDFFMTDIQAYILGIMKTRAEQEMLRYASTN
ncbi:MAG: hypothetical protein AAF629_03695 [Chloroflexota bacterium]